MLCHNRRFKTTAIGSVLFTSAIFLSDFVWQCRQSSDHDFDLAGGTDPDESFSSNRCLPTM
jgi:hypothetical protein